MRLKTSFINRGILLNDFKRFTWLGAAYLLGLFLSMPLKILMLYSKPEEVKIHYNVNTYLQIFHFDSSPLQLMLLIIVPVLAGLFLFRYLQAGEAVDMEHALPIRRETLYNTHIIVGLILLFVPLILNALISWAFIVGLGITQVNSLAILSWLSVSLLMNLLFFMSSVAVGMFTGISTVQGILTYIMLLLPAGLSTLLLYNLRMYIFGFGYGFYCEGVERLSPLLRISEFSRSAIQPVEVSIYLLCSIGLYFLGRYLYQRRQLETAGSAITFEVLRPVFKYGVTFCAMLLVGAYFFQVQNSMAWTYFGYFLGSFLGYFLMEILLNKSLYVFRRRQVIRYGIYGLIVIALISLLHYDCSGYEKKLPELAQVESVYMDNSFWPLIRENNKSQLATQRYDYQEAFQPVAVFSEEANLANIHALHEQIIANRTEEKRTTFFKQRRGTNICLAYKLKDGSHIYRQYNIELAEYKPQVKPLYESKEYKKLHYEILNLNPTRVNLVEINAREGNKYVRIADQELIRQAVAILQKDVYAQSFEEMILEQRPPWAQVTLVMKAQYKGAVDIPWAKTYSGFEAWLKEIGKYQQARLLPAEISYALVEKDPDQNNVPQRETYPVKSGMQNLLELEKKPGVLKITEQSELELCLRSYRDVFKEHPEYAVYFQLKNGGTFSGTFYADDVPDFIKKHFSH